MRISAILTLLVAIPALLLTLGTGSGNAPTQPVSYSEAHR
jgi:C4-dicarboxylate transporter